LVLLEDTATQSGTISTLPEARSLWLWCR